MDRYKRQITLMLSWSAVFIWMALIFSLSAQPADESNGLSLKVTKIIIRVVYRFVDADSGELAIGLEGMNHIIRKLAHFTAYLILGLLIMNAFRRSGVPVFKAFILSLIFCVLFAISDEVHQLFVPGRGARVVDVLIDTAGVVVGEGICGKLFAGR